MLSSYKDIYQFYLLGHQPYNIDNILNRLDIKWRSDDGENRVFKSITGAIILHTKLFKIQNGIREVNCYVDKKLAEMWK